MDNIPGGLRLSGYRGKLEADAWADPYVMKEWYGSEETLVLSPVFPGPVSRTGDR